MLKVHLLLVSSSGGHIVSETDAPGAGDGYIDSYVAFMDILRFSALTDRAVPDWRKFLTDTIRLLRTRLPARIEHNRFRATQFSDCIVISVQGTDQSLFTRPGARPRSWPRTFSTAVSSCGAGSRAAISTMMIRSCSGPR
jgi:hypothetical protein